MKKRSSARLVGKRAKSDGRRAKSERPSETRSSPRRVGKPAASDGQRRRANDPVKKRSSPRRVGKPAASDARSLASKGARSARPRSACAASGVRRAGPSATARGNAGDVARVTGADRPSFFENGRSSFRRRRGGARAQRVTVVVGRMMAAFRARRSEPRPSFLSAVAKPSPLGTGVICRRPRLCEDGGGTKSGQPRNL